VDITYTVGQLQDCAADHLILKFECREDAIALIADLALALQNSDQTLDEMGGLSTTLDILATP